VLLGSALLFGGAVAVLPGLAGARYDAPPTVTAGTNNLFSPMQASIQAGGRVTFANAPINFGHNVHFVIAPTAPQCDSSLPSSPSTASWSGSCTFTVPGSYTFICDRHGHYDASTGQVTGMSGTITVSGGGTTTTTTTITTTTATTTTTPSTAVAAAASGLTVRSSQRGRAIRAGIAVSLPASTLTAELLYRGKPLGHVTKAGLAAGRLKFTVRLSAGGRALLQARRTLKLTLRLTVTAAGASPTTVVRKITLHA
jgi:plastocyanin